MAAPPPVFSDLFHDATKWDKPVPDSDALILLLGGVASTATGAPALYDCTTGLANLAPRSPTLIAFCPADDNDYIYVGHSLSVYPSDGNIITLVGNDPNSCQPVALPATAFARTDVRAIMQIFVVLNFTPLLSRMFVALQSPLPELEHLRMQEIETELGIVSLFLRSDKWSSSICRLSKRSANIST